MTEKPPYNAAVLAVPMPDRIRRLPVSAKGFPVPQFVATVDGVPDFRVIGRDRIAETWNAKRCWVCGEPLGRHLASVIGPMCSINRIISEPPSHLECARFAARACPFLANPRARRHEADLPENAHDAPGLAIKRNPGVAAVWVSRQVKPFRADDGVLFDIGEPTTVEWFAEGRAATRAEVEASIGSGLPLLIDAARQQGPTAEQFLLQAIQRAAALLPPPASGPASAEVA